MATTAQNLSSVLSQFTGDLDRYQHALDRKVVYTPGVKALADEAGAYWLIDAIASYQGEIRRGTVHGTREEKEMLKAMQFWTLKVTKDEKEGHHRASLILQADSDRQEAVHQKIGYTDFPEGEWSIWVAANELGGVTIYLPSEH